MSQFEFISSSEDHPGSSSATEEEILAKAAHQALSERPRISVRLRISLVFLLCFLLTSAITVALIILISRISERQFFLETVANFHFEILQARRFEKNFFLYDANLQDALDQITKAKTILETYEAEIQSVIGNEDFEKMRSSLEQYDQQLHHLFRLRQDSSLQRSKEQEIIEKELRAAGTQILQYAADVILQERYRMHTLIHTSTLTATGSLVLLLLLMIYMASFLARQIVRPLNRLERHTQRIAAGDFSPILPARKYRDEFSNLTIAMNTMVYELKSHQEELMQSRKMAAVGTLTAGIAHELNNPLNNISLITESLLDDFDDYPENQKKKMLGDIFTQVERASGTVRNLLDFTRMEKPAFVSLNIKEVITATLKLITNEAMLNNVELELDLNDDLPLIKGNSRNLQQVFLNIFLNGIQAMPTGGKLSIHAAKTDERLIRVDVKDTGSGISAEHLDKIFDPFFTTKEVGMGTGLGLSVSYGIIEKHNGKISVQSQEGAGTIFSVFLPYTMNHTK